MSAYWTVLQTLSAASDDQLPVWFGFALTMATTLILVGVSWGSQKSQIKELVDKYERLHDELSALRLSHEKRLAVLSQEAAANEVKVDQLLREMDTKASAESVKEIKAQLSKIDSKLDALLMVNKKEGSR